MTPRHPRTDARPRPGESRQLYAVRAFSIQKHGGSLQKMAPP